MAWVSPEAAIAIVVVLLIAAIVTFSGGPLFDRTTHVVRTPTSASAGG